MNQWIKGLTLLTLLYGCRPDVADKTWETDILTPLLTTELDVRDLVGDTLVEANADGSLTLVKQASVFRFGMDDLLEPLSTTLENTVKLNSIDLGQRTIAQSVSLGLIARNLGIQGVPILLAHGSTAPIPTVNSVPPFDFPINANQYFTTMTLSDGWLVIRFENDFPIPITNLSYSLENSNGGAVIASGYIPQLNPGAVEEDSVQLINKTVSGNLLARINTLESPGSSGNPVPIDTNDAVTVQITIADLVPTSATAVFPDQEVINDTDAVAFEGDMDLTTMVVDSGRLILDAISTVEDVLQFEYILPTAYSTGALPFVMQEPVLAAPPSGSAITHVSRSIAGYTINMVKNGPAGPEYGTFDAIVRARIDSSGQLINLSLDDSLHLITGIRNLWPYKVEGYLGRDTLQLADETVQTELLNDLQGGSFTFEDAQVGFLITNRIGAPMELILSQAVARRQGVTDLPISWSQFGNVFSIGAATDQPPLPPQETSTFLALSPSNSNILDLISYRPEELEFDLEVRMNPVTIPSYNNFIYTEKGLNVDLVVRLPLKLSAEGLILSDTSEFAYESLDSENRIIDGTFKLIARNGFPLEAVISIDLLNDSNQVITTLLSSDLIEAADVHPDGQVHEEKRSVLSFELSPSNIPQLKEASRMVFRSIYSTRPANQKVTIYDHYKTRLTLSGDFQYRSP